VFARDFEANDFNGLYYGFDVPIGDNDPNQVQITKYQLQIYNSKPIHSFNQFLSKCIWFEPESNLWWMGDCEDEGTTNGYAYMDLPCSSPQLIEGISERYWREKHSHRILSGQTVQGT
jgi:hypothetical protein